MATPLSREKALGSVRAHNTHSDGPRIPTQLELVAQQALAIQSQANALVGVIMTMLAQQAPEEPSGPQMPATFGGGSRHEEDGQ